LSASKSQLLILGHVDIHVTQNATQQPPALPLREHMAGMRGAGVPK